MTQAVITLDFVIPGDLTLPTGGYAYDRAVIAALPDAAAAVRHTALPAGFPFPSQRDIAESAALLAATRGDVLLIDGLAFGAFPASLLAACRQPVLALVHHPLARETGLEPGLAERLKHSEINALRHARGIVATSAETARTLVADYAVAQEKIAVAPPGTARFPLARGSGAAQKRHAGLEILAVGSVIPRKAYDVLIAALADITEIPWHLTIVGSLERDAQHVLALKEQISSAGLEARVNLAGALDDVGVGHAFETCDIFVMPSHYEGYGMALAEAMAHGVAIITSTGGALGETAPDTAAIKIAPGDVPALRAALVRLLRSEPDRHALARNAHAAGRALPGWDETARVVAAAARRVLAQSATQKHA